MDVNSIVYKRLGATFCAQCIDPTSGTFFSRIQLDGESTRALRREVSYCPSCNTMSIGEKIPPGMAAFFDSNPDCDLPPTGPFEPVSV